MTQYFVGGFIAYTAYNMHGLWNDALSYFQMKAEEYTRVYTYDSYDLEPEPEVNDDKPYDCRDIKVNEVASSGDPETEGLCLKKRVLQFAIGVYFDMLTLYCACENQWIETTKTNTFAYLLHSVFKYIGKTWKHLTCGHLIEPDANIWVDNVSIYRVKQENGRFTYNINDSYAYQVNLRCGVSEFLLEMNRCVERNASRMIGQPTANSPVGVIDVIGHVIIGKYTDADGKSCFVVSAKKVPETIETSGAAFMSIEYVHPTMTETIPIEVPSNMLICGNALFTNAFVLRALLHQPKPFFFDMEYKIKIVDGMVNIIELKSDEYLVLNKNGYDVKKV